MFISVVIPTRGRSQTCRETVESVLRQTRVPDQILLSAVEKGDISSDLPADPKIQLIFGTIGSCKQRNRAFDALDPRCDAVCLLDDDVELGDDYFQKVEQFFAARPDVAGFSGCIVALDDKTREQAKEILRQWIAEERFAEGTLSLACSMNLRRKVVNEVRFDERLALYGRLEDADYAAQSRHLGIQGTYLGCRVAHLMERKGRLPGLRYGFSQIMNPFYLWRKGSMPSLREVLWEHWTKCFGSNMRGLFRRRRRVDYWGRLRGNFIALWLIVRGRVEPEYIEKL